MDNFDLTEQALLKKLRENRSRINTLALEPSVFLENNPDKEFSDPEYFRRHNELTREGDKILDEINAYRRRKNT